MKRGLTSKVEELLEKGTRELINGRFAEAIDLYSDAINEDSKNFSPYFKRATAYLASGKTKSAIPDLEKTIELKPDYYPAFKARANANLKTGEFLKAKEDFSKLEAYDAAYSKSGLNQVSQLKDKYEEAKILLDHGSFTEALPILDSLMDSVNLNKEILEWRARCNLKTGEIQRGIQDLRHSVHLVNDNRAGLLDISLLMYDYGLAVQSLEEIRECLRLDQDDKACHNHYKKVKKLAKAVTGAEDASENGNWDECVRYAKNIPILEPNVPSYKDQAELNLCHCLAKKGSPDALEHCLLVVEKHPSVTEYKQDLATAHMNRDELDEAIKVYQQILESDRGNREAQEGMEKAQRLKKQKSRRDYYKILGVTKSATKKEINKAYRKMAAEWHPDRFEAKDKKMAENKFIDITDAKEVLTDDEKRQKFDMGIDPLDPEQASGGGGGGGHRGGFDGFHFNGFNPFEHGGGNFEFHFG
ncbi:DnaJ subfamily C member 3 [Cichlidogyrus casuarinus]|uniref:DnaJ subfamily C member 3 n=1 Tax=Cichlidogyrus casuarinus TaxID=1844966 RepID=A0ABD2PR88_9PLAT